MHVRFAKRFVVLLILAGGGLLAFVPEGGAQDLQPRRWSHLPVNMNFGGAGYAYTNADIGFDPVMLIEDAEMDLHAAAFQYIRTFELFGKSARLDMMQAYADVRWNGLLNGSQTSTSRSGWSDTTLRFAVNLFGAPPLKGKEFAAYRAGVAPCETVVGAGLVVQLPTGHYRDERLLNLGSNRFTFRPQLGVVHSRGKWSAELTTSMWIFTDNDEFWNGNKLENDPLYTLQGHVVYTFRPGLWIAGGLAYGRGLESTFNGSYKDDRKENLLFGASLGVPITRQVGFKIGYLGMRTQNSVGSDSDTFVAAFSFMW